MQRPEQYSEHNHNLRKATLLISSSASVNHCGTLAPEAGIPESSSSIRVSKRRTSVYEQGSATSDLALEPEGQLSPGHGLPFQLSWRAPQSGMQTSDGCKVLAVASRNQDFASDRLQRPHIGAERLH